MQKNKSHHTHLMKVFHFRLSLQCRYSGTSVEALVVELGLQDPPESVAAEGPVRVQLKLASGRCTEKGCNEGISFFVVCQCCCFCRLFLNMDFLTNVCLCSYSGGSLYLFLRSGRLPCDQSAKRAGVCGSWTHGKDRSYDYPHSWSLLGNRKLLSPQLASMGYFNKWVTKFKIHFIYIYSKSV